MTVELLEKRPINIRDLVITERVSPPQSPFDPVKYLPEEFWSDQVDAINKSKNRSAQASVETLMFYNWSVPITLLNPQVAKNIERKDSDFDNILKVVTNTAEDLRAYFPGLAVAAKMLFPQRFPELALYAVESWVEIIQAVIRSAPYPTFAQQDHASEEIIGRMSDFKLAYPHLAKPILEEHEDAIRTCGISRMYYYNHQNLAEPFLAHAANMKILFPDYNHSLYHLASDHSLRENKRELIEQSQKINGTAMIPTEACNIAILKAEELRITEKDIEIIMQKDQDLFKHPTPELPVLRNY